MGDMSPRPRGGWQVGTSLTRLRKSLVETDTDEAGYYTVDRSAAPTFVVRHFATADATRPCCRPVKVTQRAGESETDALARAAQMCEQQHVG